MGGYGSGRYGGKPIAEHCLRIDIAWMIGKGFAVPGAHMAGQLHWTRGGEPSGDIGYSCDMTDPDAGELVLRFTTGANRGEPKEHVQRIRLSYTTPKFGGRRWWMHCPFNGERVGKLYVPPGRELFASRKAWKIGYRSQRGSRQDRNLNALFAIQERLGGERGMQHGLCRPKGMHWRTFERHEARYEQLEHQCNLATMMLVNRLTRAR